MAIKDAYTTQELSKLLGITVKSTLSRADSARESWRSRPRKGKGGGHEWLVDSMPEETRLTIRAAEEKTALAERSDDQITRTPSTTVSLAIMDDKRRHKALAKADLVRQYLAWQRRFGSTHAQRDAFIAAYMGGVWPKLLQDLGAVSWKSIERWKLEQSRAGNILALADKRGIAHKGRTLLTERHMTIILGHVLNPNAPNVSQCVRQVQAKCQAEGLFIPSDPTIRRFVRSYVSECYDEWTLWREGKKAWNDRCAISILRDWNLVEVGDIVIADGHTLNFETLNPETGKPGRMTLLLFYDGASNHPLGWEIMASENTACISSAFRRTCLVLGKFPRVIYLDNGKAFRSEFFKGCADFEQAGVLGLYKDLGCEVIHAWPYHGQSKPIERFFGTMHDMEIWMPSYTGNDIAHKPARMKRGEDLHRQLYDKLGGRPLTLEETHTQVAKWFAEYANRPQLRTHLKGHTPAEVFQEGRGEGLNDADVRRLTLLMMQKEIRTITKDGFRLNGKLFWHEKLASRRHSVLVRYDDLFSPHNVLVYTMDGEFLCEAQDREHYQIAYGVHPAARVLGTDEQRQALDAAIALRLGQERESSSTMRTMLQAVVLPETQARLAALEAATDAATPTPTTPLPAELPTVGPEQEAAFEQAKAEAHAALNSAPAYVPSDLKRWKDSQERYAYLFSVKFEQGMALVAADEAWMETFEQTEEFERYLKRRYSGLRSVYERQGNIAQIA